MTKVLAVNNYPGEERFRRLRSCLEGAGAEVTSVGWEGADVPLFSKHDGVVLSGSPDMMSEDSILAKFSGEVGAIRDSRVPILGVCFGHQMIARAFGSRVVKAPAHVLKFVRTDPVVQGGLFEGLSRHPMLLESRYEVVESLPERFVPLASSETTPIAAMKHRSLPVYGVQSHPERFTKENPEGRALVRNFVEMLR